MKTTHRSLPNDIFSVEHKGKTIQIITHHQEIAVVVDGIINRFSFDQFHSALQGLLSSQEPSPPSSDDKEAATAPEKGKNSHP